jgi:hypothetical protein
MGELSYPVQVLAPENGVNELVRLITAIRVVCVDTGGDFFGTKFSEGELQDFFDTHPHRYFEVEPKGAVDAAVKKITKAVVDSLKNGALKLSVTRVNFEDGEVDLMNSWVEASTFSEWCESRSIELGESWWSLLEEELKIASAASEEGENFRRSLEGGRHVEEIEAEFEGRGMDSLFAEIDLLRSKQKQPVARKEKALTTRERDTLLTIIAVLCKEAKIDYTKPAKAAGMIQSTAATMGVAIGETTIEGHLKKIHYALATRMK